MNKRVIFSNCFFCLLLGCATTYVQPLLEYGGGEQLEPPALVLVHDFSSSSGNTSSEETAGPEIDKRTKAVREANTVLCAALTEAMKKLGLPAQRASDPVPDERITLSIEGEFLCLDKGSSLKRMLIGFGAGAAQVNAIVRISLHCDGEKKLLQEFMATVETSDRGGLGPAALGIGPVPGGGLLATTLSSGASAVSERWGSGIEALTMALATEIAKSFIGFSVRQGWMNPVMY